MCTRNPLASSPTNAGGLLHEREARLGDGDAVGRHPRRLGRPPLGPGRDLVGVAHLGEHAEVLDLGPGDGVAGEKEPAGQHRSEAMEEEVQVAQRGPEQPGAGHPELGVARHDGEVGHERDLERTAEGVGLDLRNGDLRVRHELVVEGEALAVDAEPAALAGATVVRVVAVPRVRVGHVGTGAEHAAGAAQDHHLDVVVDRELVEVRTHGAPHRRVVRVASLRVVDGDARDVRRRITLEMHASARVRSSPP